jgi:hypothetical protein
VLEIIEHERRTRVKWFGPQRCGDGYFLIHRTGPTTAEFRGVMTPLTPFITFNSILERGRKVLA